MATPDGSEMRLKAHDTILIPSSLTEIEVGVRFNDVDELWLPTIVTVTYDTTPLNLTLVYQHRQFLSKPGTKGYRYELYPSSSEFRIEIEVKNPAQWGELIYFYVIKTDKMSRTSTEVPTTTEAKPTDTTPIVTELVASSILDH